MTSMELQRLMEALIRGAGSDGFGHFYENAYGNHYGNTGNSDFWHFTEPNGSYQEYHFEDGNMDDIWENLFGGSFHTQNRRQKGPDLHAGITIDFDEAVYGCDKVIQLSDTDGTGSQSLKVHIPAGIDTGKSIRLRNKGMPGSRGGEAGDLLLEVTVRDKPGFERKGMDVYTTIYIPYTTCVFGGEAVVQTLYGKVMCKIAEGTQSGTKIRLKGKGIISMKDKSVHGDQYVTVEVAVPKHIIGEAKWKLKEYEQACNGKSPGRSVKTEQNAFTGEPTPGLPPEAWERWLYSFNSLFPWRRSIRRKQLW